MEGWKELGRAEPVDSGQGVCVCVCASFSSCFALRVQGELKAAVISCVGSDRS